MILFIKIWYIVSMANSKTYLIYFEKGAIPADADIDEKLKGIYGKENVYRLNKSTTWAIKTEEQTVSSVIEKTGFNPEEKMVGVATEIGSYNGFYSQKFWDFLSTAPSRPNNSKKESKN